MPTTGSEPPWATYRIGRGETGVLTVEPYKSQLLPLWRFKTPAIARTSSAALWTAFLKYEKEDDFVGMDMARKFLQMGMTRAKRYANHKGGSKYGAGGKGKGEVVKVAKGEDWKGRSEKEEASLVFREVWEKARGWEGYQMKKAEFLRRQKERDKQRKRENMSGGKSMKAEREVSSEDKASGASSIAN